VGRLQQQLDGLQKKLRDRPLAHVLFVVWMDPLITTGQNTFIADALRWAGAESVVLSKNKWPQLSIEEVVRLQPDYIVFTTDHGGTGASQLADLRERPAWRDLDAVEQGHVVDVSEEAVRPSPGLVDAIEQLAHVLHPDAFSAANATARSMRRDEISMLAAETTARCDSCAR
jgi:iron complex transport system substrate-binding protein